jgi:hypothetical protein
MTDTAPETRPADHARRPLLLLLGYYALLGAAYLALTLASPWFAERLTGVPRDTAGGLDLTARVLPITESAGQAFSGALLTMAAALLLVLPVVWVYTYTRHKRGFQQSLAQTLVILPIVVAVVVILVKHSVALAFSLGGIVGAVAFRHRLEDTKDAVYIFVTIAIGLAAGVQAYTVAYAASLFYNIVVVGLWLTDFARVPGQLIPRLAARRVQLAKDMVENRQSKEYVAQLDQQLLQSMTPDQLKALANRALERNQQYQRNYDDRPAGSTVSDPLETVVTATATTDSLAGLRATIEAVLSRDAKGWRFDAETPTSDGRVSVRYVVRCRKKRPAPRLQDALRRAVVALTDDVAVQ